MKLSKFIKPILRSKTSHAFISWLISIYIRFVYMTTKWTFIGFDERDSFCEKQGGKIVLQWHNRIALAPFGWPVKQHPLTLLSSGHRDGRLVSDSCRHLGINAILGSSGKGGASALRQMIKTIRSGTSISMSPDGPRGPRLRMKDGPAVLAKMTGCPVSTITYSVKKRKLMKSWDRFVFPMPFNKGVIKWHELKGISKDASFTETEAYKDYLEAEMNRITDELDAMMGHDPIAPADPNELVKTKTTKDNVH